MFTEMSDLTSHRIEGLARMAVGDQHFECPLITQVDGNLWQGGVPPKRLPDDFKFVVNLYPWEPYRVPDHVTVLTARLYDSEDIPDPRLLHGIADWVNVVREIGPTLVHCQAGLNRSALITGLALVKSGFTPEGAIAHMRDVRSPLVLCNTQFEDWLMNYAE